MHDYQLGEREAPERHPAATKRLTQQPDKGAVALRRAGKKGGPQAAFPFARFRWYWTRISTRRFCGSRTLSPVGTSSWLSPLPMTVIAWGRHASRTKASLTAWHTQRQRHVVTFGTRRIGVARRRDARIALRLKGGRRLLDRG